MGGRGADLVDGHVFGEILVEASHHVPLVVVVGIVVGEREDLGVHAELGDAIVEVGHTESIIAAEDRGNGIANLHVTLVGRAKHACRERVGGLGEGRRRGVRGV